jgi:hypothetical protein
MFLLTQRLTLFWPWPRMKQTNENVMPTSENTSTRGHENFQRKNNSFQTAMLKLTSTDPRTASRAGEWRLKRAWASTGNSNAVKRTIDRPSAATFVSSSTAPTLWTGVRNRSNRNSSLQSSGDSDRPNQKITESERRIHVRREHAQCTVHGTGVRNRSQRYSSLQRIWESTLRYSRAYRIIALQIIELQKLYLSGCGSLDAHYCLMLTVWPILFNLCCSHILQIARSCFVILFKCYSSYWIGAKSNTWPLNEVLYNKNFLSISLSSSSMFSLTVMLWALLCIVQIWPWKGLRIKVVLNIIAFIVLSW